MLHEEKDYDISKIPDDEPVFLLRGKDPAAFVAVKLWAQISYERGMISREKLNQVLNHSDRMRKHLNKLCENINPSMSVVHEGDCAASTMNDHGPGGGLA